MNRTAPDSELSLWVMAFFPCPMFSTADFGYVRVVGCAVLKTAKVAGVLADPRENTAGADWGPVRVDAKTDELSLELCPPGGTG
jgi:hypothetical protein